MEKLQNKSGSFTNKNDLKLSQAVVKPGAYVMIQKCPSECVRGIRLTEVRKYSLKLVVIE